MRHVVWLLQTYPRDHWDVLRHALIRGAAFGMLALIEEWGVEAEGGPMASDTRRTHGGVRVRRSP